MKVNKQLARDAKKKGICEEWYDRLIDTKDLNPQLTLPDIAVISPDV